MKRKTPALDARAKAAVEELEGTLRQHYPEATFSIRQGVDSPESIELWTTVDVEDTDLVLDCVVDRVMELQLEEQLPIHVIPIRPPERVLAMREEAARSPRRVPSAL